jgi:hypothetical protein
MTAFLIVSAAAALWVLSLLVRPFGKCWRCRGKGNIRKKGRRKAPKCWVCKGARRRQRLGSRTAQPDPPPGGVVVARPAMRSSQRLTRRLRQGGFERARHRCRAPSHGGFIPLVVPRHGQRGQD